MGPFMSQPPGPGGGEARGQAPGGGGARRNPWWAGVKAAQAGSSLLRGGAPLVEPTPTVGRELPNPTRPQAGPPPSFGVEQRPSQPQGRRAELWVPHPSPGATPGAAGVWEQGSVHRDNWPGSGFPADSPGCWQRRFRPGSLLRNPRQEGAQMNGTSAPTPGVSELKAPRCRPHPPEWQTRTLGLGRVRAVALIQTSCPRFQLANSYSPLKAHPKWPLLCSPAPTPRG